MEYYICPRVGVQLSYVHPPAWIDMVVVHLKGLLGVRLMLTSLFVHSLDVNIGPSQWACLPAPLRIPCVRFTGGHLLRVRLAGPS